MTKFFAFGFFARRLVQFEPMFYSTVFVSSSGVLCPGLHFALGTAAVRCRGLDGIWAQVL